MLEAYSHKVKEDFHFALTMGSQNNGGENQATRNFNQGITEILDQLIYKVESCQRDLARYQQEGVSKDQTMKMIRRMVPTSNYKGQSLESDTNPAEKSYMMEGKFESKEALHPQNEFSYTEPSRKAEPQINITNFHR